MHTSLGPLVRIPRADILYFLFLLAAGGMLWYPSQASAASPSCTATPFSQTIKASEAVTYTIAVTSDVSGSTVKLALGNLPTGVTGGFVGSDSVVTPGEVSLAFQTTRSARTASFSLVILEDISGQTPTNVICQYALRILAPPPLPPSPSGGEEGETAETPAPKESPATEEEAPSAEPQEAAAPVPSPEAQAPPLKKKEEFSFGSRGGGVAEVQALLAKDPTLYPEGLVTGWYGPLTRSAVRRFQERVGITPTGEVDAATQEKLDDLRKTKAPSFRFRSYLIREVRGNSVVTLQNILKQLGFFPKFVPATGYFGPITEASVKRYQKSRRIETTGTVGPITRTALNKE